jgi:hypothetical protein
MIRLSINLTGKDAALISTCYRIHSGMCGLNIYKDAPQQLATDRVKEKIDNYQHHYEGGATGNHASIAERNLARKEVTELFKKIVRFLEIIATEADIPALILAGFNVRKSTAKKKTAGLQPA